MFSIICSIYDENKYNKILLPSLRRVIDFTNSMGYPPIQIINVSGTKSLCENYNLGLAKAKYNINFFIHEDVDVMDFNGAESIFYKIVKIFSKDKDIGLIGLVGTKRSGKNLWWTEFGPDFIYGSMLTHKDKKLWKWNTDFEETQVEIADGFFMATNHKILWNTDIKGFHFYDCDYCNKYFLLLTEQALSHNLCNVAAVMMGEVGN